MHAELLAEHQDLGASVRLRKAHRQPAMVICSALLAEVMATGFTVRRSTVEMAVVVWAHGHHIPYLDGVAQARSWIFEAPRAVVVAPALVVMVAWIGLGKTLVPDAGTSRCYLGVHLPSDIVASMVHGASAGPIVFRATFVAIRPPLDLRAVRPDQRTPAGSGDDA